MHCTPEDGDEALLQKRQTSQISAVFSSSRCPLTSHRFIPSPPVSGSRHWHLSSPHQHDIPPHFLDGPAFLLSNCHFLVLDVRHCHRRRRCTTTTVPPSNPQPCLNSGSSSQLVSLSLNHQSGGQMKARGCCEAHTRGKEGRAALINPLTFLSLSVTLKQRVRGVPGERRILPFSPRGSNT